MELNAERGSSVSETLNNLSILGVPKLNHLVKPSTQESTSIVTEVDVSHGLSMTHICSEAPSMIQNIPDFDGSIMTS